jgi:HAD superfamily phosphoserine phosphatase-like hydrolase
MQLDFDGTLVEEDASTGILGRFAGAEWPDRVDAASRVLRTDPDSPALIDTMIAGYACLGTDFGAYLDYVHEHHPPRPGLRELIDTASRLGIEVHVISNGFEFYIRDHLRAIGVEDRVAVHTGSVADGALLYRGPEGTPVRTRFKERWTRHFLRDGATVIYVGDGTSDVAAASLCFAAFARDSLLTGLQGSYKGALFPFETLQDVARELDALLDDQSLTGKK